jgi:glycosyltransferase involved in cell wall biosynthesis
VAVVLPVRDGARWLDAALASLHAQSLAAFRVLLVDDGSRDESAAIARAWAGRDPRFELLQRPARGLVPALNDGIAAALACGAPYIARMDADDVCLPERLARQTGFLDSAWGAGVDVLDSRVDCFRDGAALPPGMARYQRWHDGIEDHSDFEREFLVENPVCHPAVMLRASVLRRLHEPAAPYRPGAFPEDYELWLRLLRAGARFHKLPERLLRWRDRDERLTRRGAAYVRPAFFRARWEHFAAYELPRLGPAPRIAVWGSKEHGRPWIRALSELGFPPVAVVEVDPRLFGRRRRGAPVIPPEALGSLQPGLVLLAVGAAGARALMEPRLRALGLPWLAVAGLAG